MWEIGHRFPVTAPKGNGIRHAKTQFFAYNLGGFKKDALEHCCATDCLVLPVFPLEIERALRVFRLIPISHAWDFEVFSGNKPPPPQPSWITIENVEATRTLQHMCILILKPGAS